MVNVKENVIVLEMTCSLEHGGTLIVIDSNEKAQVYTNAGEL